MSNQPTNQPLVSICIPSYNHQNYISQTIESIILQDYQNIELIIIDDCSIDNSDAVINSFFDKCKRRFSRFEYIKNAKNKGISYNLNQAIKWAQGKYFYAIASDDILMPFKTSLLVSEIEKLDDSYAAIFGDALFINENGKKVYINNDKKLFEYNDEHSITDIKINKYYSTVTEFFLKDRKLNKINDNIFDINYSDILISNFIPAMSSLLKLQCMKKVGGFKNGNRMEDLEMWLKLAQLYKLSFIKKPVALYRIHSSNSFLAGCGIELLKDECNIVFSQKNYVISNDYYRKLFYERLCYQLSYVNKYDEQFAKRSADFLSKWIFQKIGEKITFFDNFSKICASK